MNQPAPDWPSAPAPDAPAAPPAPIAAPLAAPAMAAPLAPLAMAAPPAPPAPLAAAPDTPAIQAMPQFMPPSSPEAALDITAPLMPVMPQQPSAPDFASPAGFAPEGFATPQAGFAGPQAGFAGPQAGLADAPHADHPTSLAMPTAEHAPSNAMPTFASSESSAPQQIGGVTAAYPADLADRAALAGDPVTELDTNADPTGQWWAPGIALVLAVAALAWQLVAFYARVQLPIVRDSQTPLTNFDNVVVSVPFADSAIGQVVGVLLAAGALVILLYGSRRGLREPQLQITIGAIAALSMLCMVALPVLRG